MSERHRNETRRMEDRKGSMSEIYDRACTTCGHKISDHDANECWKTVDGEQCDCGWMGVPDE